MIHLICTQPNRYPGIAEKRPFIQQEGNLIIYRVNVPQHSNQFYKQLISFYYYQKEVLKISRQLKLDFIFVSTSKLFTGYLACKIARRNKIGYYLDLRDLFADNLRELIKIPIVNNLVSSFIKRFFQRPTMLNARHINVNSEGFKNSIPLSYKGSLSFFPNGIDEIFSTWKQDMKVQESVKTICYAGNIGEGQGLEKIIPPLAVALKNTHRFVIIGDGSSRQKLANRIKEGDLSNVILIPVMKRENILSHYKKAHYLFLHLNDYKSFEKVLPSKLFEYGSGNIPILAGVKGYAREFIENELRDNVFVFEPCDVEAVSNYLRNHTYQLKAREDFVKKYNRKEITARLADSIIEVMKLNHA